MSNERFEWKENKTGKKVLADRLSSYELHVLPNDIHLSFGSHFYFEYMLDGVHVYITTRNFRGKDRSGNYQNRLRRDMKTIQKDSVIVEVGAGLGGFVEAALDAGYQPPIRVIDCANFALTEKMLMYVRESEISGNEALVKNLDMLLRRNRLLLYDERVELFNMRLGQALEKHPELVECADLVVDNNGAFHYKATEKEHVGDLHLRLLKPNGTVYRGIGYEPLQKGPLRRRTQLQ